MALLNKMLFFLIPHALCFYYYILLVHKYKVVVTPNTAKNW